MAGARYIGASEFILDEIVASGLQFLSSLPSAQGRTGAALALSWWPAGRLTLSGRRLSGDVTASANIR
jgi:hypothetical protein